MVPVVYVALSHSTVSPLIGGLRSSGSGHRLVYA
nr:MAG TPA: hypothetical protein [Caudoviricetes sp.]